MSALDESGFPGKFKADVSGSGNTHGYAVIAVGDNLDEIAIELYVEEANQPTQATVHLTREGSVGPIVLWLYPENQTPRVKPGEGEDGESNADEFYGILASRVISEDELVGPLDGAPLEELVDAMLDGNASIEVYSAGNTGTEVMENSEGEMSGLIEPEDDP
jgi:hypothetical protein